MIGLDELCKGQTIKIRYCTYCTCSITDTIERLLWY